VLFGIMALPINQEREPNTLAGLVGGEVAEDRAVEQAASEVFLGQFA
jgi:hypothetical protein